MIRYRCRCRKCGARRTIAEVGEHMLEDYICGSGCDGKLRIDEYRQSGKEAKRFNCGCDGYPWQARNSPHRKGSLQCNYYRGPVTAS